MEKTGASRHGTGAREPWGQEGQMTPRNLPGGQHGILTPRFSWKEIFSGTHPHVVIEATILKLGLGVCFLLSFITDLWTPQNVALVILPPLPVKK